MMCHIFWQAVATSALMAMGFVAAPKEEDSVCVFGKEVARHRFKNTSRTTRCECDPYYEGDYCELIMCLNGGTRMPDNQTCCCPDQLGQPHCNVCRNYLGVTNVPYCNVSIEIRSEFKEDENALEDTNTSWAMVLILSFLLLLSMAVIIAVFVTMNLMRRKEKGNNCNTDGESILLAPLSESKHKGSDQDDFNYWDFFETGLWSPSIPEYSEIMTAAIHSEAGSDCEENIYNVFDQLIANLRQLTGALYALKENLIALISHTHSNSVKMRLQLKKIADEWSKAVESAKTRHNQLITDYCRIAAGAGISEFESVWESQKSQLNHERNLIHQVTNERDSCLIELQQKFGMHFSKRGVRRSNSAKHSQTSNELISQADASPDASPPL